MTKARIEVSVDYEDGKTQLFNFEGEITHIQFDPSQKPGVPTIGFCQIFIRNASTEDRYTKETGE